MYYNVAKNEYPRFAGDIQLEYPNWNIGDELPEGWANLNETVQPDIDVDNFFNQMSTPQKIDDLNYAVVWETVELSEKEKLANLAYKDLGLVADKIGLPVDKLRELVFKSVGII